MSLGLSRNIFEKIATSALRSGDYNYIILDTNYELNENLSRLIDISEKVVIVSDNSYVSLKLTDFFVSNINNTETDKFIHVSHHHRDPGYQNSNIEVDFPVTLYINSMENGRELNEHRIQDEIKQLYYLI